MHILMTFFFFWCAWSLLTSRWCNWSFLYLSLICHQISGVSSLCDAWVAMGWKLSGVDGFSSWLETYNRMAWVERVLKGHLIPNGWDMMGYSLPQVYCQPGLLLMGYCVLQRAYRWQVGVFMWHPWPPWAVSFLAIDLISKLASQAFFLFLIQNSLYSSCGSQYA